MTQADDVSIKQIADTIQTDPALAGRTLKYANSSKAASRQPLSSISQAVIRLGMRTVGTLALGFSVLSSSRKGKCQGFEYGTFWSHSLASGIAAKVLCEKSKVLAPEEGFACGLLSEVGRLALASVYPEKYTEILNDWNSGPVSKLIELEQQEFETDHTELTAAMMDDWGLPESFCLAVLKQQKYESLHASNAEISFDFLLHLAHQLANVCLAEEEQCQQAMLNLVDRYEQSSLASDGLLELCNEVVEHWQVWGEILNVQTQNIPDFEELIEQAKQQQAEKDQQDEPSEENEQPEFSDIKVTEFVEKTILKVLIAEDDPAQLMLVTKLVESAGHVVIGASNGKEALKIALETNPDIVLTDWMMPEMDGFELCCALRKSQFGRKLYLFIMTSDEEEQRLIDAFDAGADDYVVKPLKGRPLQARLRAALRMINLQREVDQEREQIREMTAELAIANRKLESAAFTDALTGLPNRRYLIQRLKQEWANSDRHGTPISCLLLDIDRFKSVNDTYRHDVGDVVLKKVAQILENNTRENDVVCRQGGEEFVVVCPGSDLSESQLAAERLCRSVEEQTLGAFEEFDHAVTVSIGVASRGAGIADEDAMIKAADELLYQAKQTGRNRVCCTSDQPADQISNMQQAIQSVMD